MSSSGASGFHRSAWLPALGVTAVGIALAGAGPVNGDAAVYLDQIVDGDWTERWTHVGYVLLGAAFRGTADPGLWLDLLSAVCAGVAVGVLGQRAAARAGAGVDPGQATGIVPGLVLAALVLPWSPFGEVDPVWLVLLALGMAADPRWGALGLAGAVMVSPTALVAIPWIVMKQQDYRWVGAVGAVGLLTVASGGEWWTGNRGVLTGGWAPAPLGHVGWILPAWLMAARSLRAVDALALLGLLAPGDVPGHWVAVLPALPGTAGNRDRRWWALLAALLGLGLQQTFDARARVRRETGTIAVIAAGIGPGDAIVGPWSWAVRINLAHHGEPDGIPWGDVPCTGRRVHVPLGTWERCEPAGE